MDIYSFLIQLLNGVQYGLLLFLVASGLTLIFGIMGIINLAHGSFYMVGAYMAFTLSSLTGNLFVAIVVGIVLSVLLGIVLEWALISHLYKRDHLEQVLLTYGLILVFEELRSLIVGNDVHGVAVPAILGGSIPLTATLSYPVYRLFMSAVCLALAGLLYLLIHRTRVGMMIRAGASNREMVSALGLNINLVYRLVFALGVALAAFAGMIAAPVSSVYPGMGTQVLIICFVVVVIGGIGSIWGALFASLLIGLADTFGKVLIPEAAGVTVYLLMAAILLWRPEGLFKRAGVMQPLSGRGAMLNRKADRHGRGAALLALFPLAGAGFYVELVAKVMILAIFALSLDLLVGYTGLVSFGHAAFYGIGAYTLGLMTPKYEAANFWLTLPAAMLAAGIAAFAVGVFVVRVKGVYFIMVTLAFAQMFYFLFHDTKFGRGSDGISMNFKPDRLDRRIHAVRPRQRDARVLLRARAARRGVRVSERRAALAVRPRAAGNQEQRAPDALARLSRSIATSSRASRWPAPSRVSPATCRRFSSAS